MQKMFILFRFDRLVKMINRDGLTKKFVTLVTNMECALEYQTLYSPILDPLMLASCFLPSVYFPRELINVIVSYCGLDASSKEDEEAVVKRIINFT